MKKQIKRLNLSKKTITNLTSNEMNQKVGGDKTKGGTRCWTCYGFSCARAC